MSKKVQRYTWCDALIEASADNGKTYGIKTGVADMGLRLARVINWEPNDGRPSGLYWDNETAAEVVGVSRANFYRHLKVLKAEGFFVLEKGNLLPVIPESQIETREVYDARVEAIKTANELKKSQTETSKSQNDTEKSQVETPKSHFDNPYSEDTYTEDSLSEDSSSEVAPAPSLCDNDTYSSSLYEDDFEIEWDTVQTEEVPKSQNETFEENEDVDVENTVNSRVSVREIVRVRGIKGRWSKMKSEDILNKCLARIEMHDGTPESLVDEVQATWEVGDDW